MRPDTTVAPHPRRFGRAGLAILAGLAGFLLYLGLVLRVGDWAAHWHWAPQFAFYAAAGIAWVWPARRLMVWAAR